MKQLLFTPGPVNVAGNVRTAITSEDICHREPEFDRLLESVETKLLALLEISKPEKYSAVVITGSGSAANEAMLSSVVGDGSILILSNGEFGERLHKTSVIHNKHTHLIDAPWGDALNLETVEKFLQKNAIDVIAMVHHETCSGMLNPIASIGELAKRHNAIFIVDGISSVGSEHIDMENDNIAFCSGSSSKAIGSYAGLSFVVGQKTQFEKLKHHRAKTTYLNLATFYAFLKTRSQTPNTPGVPLFFAFEKALANILREGVANRISKLKRKANLLRRGMIKLNLRFLLDEEDMCSMLTAVHLPPHLDVSILRQKLRDKSIIIYEGKGCFKGNSFQVGNIGELTILDINFFLASLREILLEVQLPIVQPEKLKLLLDSVMPIGIAPTEQQKLTKI